MAGACHRLTCTATLSAHCASQQNASFVSSLREKICCGNVPRASCLSQRNPLLERAPASHTFYSARSDGPLPAFGTK